MSRRTDDPFDDILAPQPRHAQQATLNDDPFGDDSPGVFDDDARVTDYVHAQSSGSGAQPSSGRHGYTMDPFFDE